jgi:hypothetical protein
MATDFAPTIFGSYGDDVTVREFVVDSAATFKKGELVYWDTSSKTLKECGTDPALVAGIALGSAGFALGTEYPGPIYQGSRIPVALFEPDALIFMCSATTPIVDHIGVKYALAKLASGNWSVDTTDTADARVIVVDIFRAVSASVSPGPQTGQDGFLVRFNSANLQFSGIF